MKRKLASIQKITRLDPIDGADKIEVATILGWSVVVRKGEFSIGEAVVYFEIDSLLPISPEFEFLAKGSRPKTMILDGGKNICGYRLKTIRLRGQISQGLVLPRNILNGAKVYEGDDVSELLGVYKYEQTIPACLSGTIRAAFPAGIPKTDEPRIQAYPELLNKYSNLDFYCTEKIDGSSVTFYLQDGELRVCSRNVDLLETPGNSFWQIARLHDIEKKLKDYGKNIALQGEVFGFGIQGNPLKKTGVNVAFFNIYDIQKGSYLCHSEFMEIFGLMGLPPVPVVEFSCLPKTVEDAVAHATRKSSINPDAWAEGVVWRPFVEMRDISIGRLSFKVINPEYLLTEN